MFISVQGLSNIQCYNKSILYGSYSIPDGKTSVHV